MDLSAWPIAPRHVDPIARGLNNTTYFVTATEGEYVLRIYRNTAEPKRVRDEHHILGLVAQQELPFRTPSPLRTREGDTLAVLETDDGPHLAAIFFRIPGEPARGTPREAHLGGLALGQLDCALARIELPVHMPLALDDVHALVPDPMAALDDLDLGHDRARISELFERVNASREPLAASLPRQIVHGDFGYVNVLLENDVVTGLLDFEFAEGDVRAADLACAIYITIVRTDDATRWPTLDALITGYRRALPLDPTEAAAIPDLLLRRSAFGIVHWIGRWRAGLCGPDEPLARVKRNALLGTWLDANAPRLALAVAGARLPARR